MQRSKKWAVPVLVLATAALGASSAALADAVNLGDGVVVDTARGVAFVANAAGDLDAVELERGHLLWSAAAAKPLAAAEGLVIAQAEPSAAGALEIVSFDPADGTRGRVKARVELPKKVRADLRDAPGRSFRAAARMEQGGLRVSWTATNTSPDGTMRGYLPSAGEGGGPAELTTGAVLLDLDSGVATEADAPAAAGVSVEALPASAVPGATGNLFASADGRHVLESARRSGDDPFEGYGWTIYARDTGEALGELTSSSSAVPFVVAGGRLLYVSQRSVRARGNEVVDEPMQLRAFDLAQGRQLWSREVSDPNFRGPFPH